MLGERGRFCCGARAIPQAKDEEGRSRQVRTGMEQILVLVWWLPRVWPMGQTSKNRSSSHIPRFPMKVMKFSLTIISSLYKLLPMNSLDATFSALADPTRRAILARLAQGEATVLELAKPFEMTQPAISQHLKVLEEAGLVVRRVDGAKRPRRLAKAGIETMDQWLAMLRKALEKNYDRLDEVLAAMEKRKKGEKR